jgi:outer membrane autotransporter protein
LAIGYTQDAFEEKGSGLLYRTAKVSEGAVFSKLGLRIGHLSQVSRNVTLGVDGTASWVHDFAASGKPISLQAVGTNGWFQNIGRRNDADTAQFNVGIQGTFMENITLRLSGQRDVGNAGSQSSGLLSIAIDF